MLLTHWPLAHAAVTLNLSFSNSHQGQTYWAFPMKMSSGECHKTSLKISRHWFRYCVGAVRQQAITWTNVKQVLWHHKAPLSHNESISFQCCLFNTLRPRQNRRHFADDVFKCNFLNENVWIPIKISLKFVTEGPINNIPALVQIMAWRRPGDKPLSEPMMVNLLTHICVTRPQWVKKTFEDVLTLSTVWIHNYTPCFKWGVVTSAVIQLNNHWS